jgi:anti-sigma-K factor RskA
VSADDFNSDHEQFSDDAAAYALGALEPDELEAFRAHLASCPICREQVAAFQQVAQTLPMSASQHDVPRGLRKRVLTAVRDEPAKENAAVQRGRSRGRLFGGSVSRPWLAAGVAGALGVGIAIGLIVSPSSTGTTQDFNAQVGAALVRLVDGHGELVVNHLPPPPPGKVYEVWLQHGNEPPQPTKILFNVTSEGKSDVGIAGDLKGVTKVLVTAEPNGGTMAPTSQPVIEAKV